MFMKTIVPVLTIAGSDCSGGAGIQADIKTMMAHGVYAMSAITAITAQNTIGVKGFEAVSPDMVSSQLEMIWADIPPTAIKTGMLANAEIISTISSILRKFNATNLVVDPVMVATSGDQLIADEAIDTMVAQLFPLATLITPNVNEALRLTGTDNPSVQIRRIHEMGVKNLMLKGGDRTDGDTKKDILSLNNGAEVIRLESPAIDTPNTHGTGCTLSAAIASRLALGHPLAEAVKGAKQYITEAIMRASDFTIGHGHGPVNHFITNRDENNNLFL